MKVSLSAMSLVAALVSAPTFAQQAQDHSAQSGAAATAPSDTASALTEGEVRRIDKDTKKITIRHGAIANLDMPPMTMVFQVSDPAMLDRVTAGDKVRFFAEKRDGAITLTRLEVTS